MVIRNHSHFITESERLRLDDIGAAHHVPFESNKIFLEEGERISTRKPLRNRRFREMKGFASSLNPLIEFLARFYVVARKWLNNYRHTQTFLTFPILSFSEHICTFHRAGFIFCRAVC